MDGRIKSGHDVVGVSRLAEIDMGSPSRGAMRPGFDGRSALFL
jgi:hypothetical protein